MDWTEHKQQLLKDPEFKKEYEALTPEYKSAFARIRRRQARGLTQGQLKKGYPKQGQELRQ